MCTVTFIPLHQKVFITSSRDESSAREHAIPPAAHPVQTGSVIFPRDPKAGGTWIAAHENGNAGVLLNGASTKHEFHPPYRKSRGLILLDIMSEIDPLECFHTKGLSEIEPFTIVLFQQGSLFECRWNGQQKQVTTCAYNKPAIWSSVTLYDGHAQVKRQAWFDEWIAKNPDPTRADILQFHSITPENDHHDGIFMNRNNLTLTVSITLFELTENFVSTEYTDTRQQVVFREQFRFPGLIPHHS